jgi:hypothetical protein
LDPRLPSPNSPCHSRLQNGEALPSRCANWAGSRVRRQQLMARSFADRHPRSLNGRP